MIFYRAIVICFLLLSSQFIEAQVFKVDTIQYQGSKDKFINIVVMGDGYTATEQAKFLLNATEMTTYLFSQAPWSNYKEYFNVFAIEVISEESGVKHPNTASDCSSASVPVSNPSTYLGVTFDYANIHRLVVPTKNGNIANVLASNFPNYDQVVILGNSPYYGGSGGAFATATNGPSSFEVAVHELGHSFAFLADEYYAGDVYANERTNMTKETDPTKVKWKNWMGFKNIGIHQHCCGGQSASWYRPHNDCKMRFLGREFCAVCSESTVKRIQNLVGSTIMDFYPKTSQAEICDQKTFHLSLIKPNPNTLKVVWELNGIPIGTNLDSVVILENQLSGNENTLKAIVQDTTLLLRDESHNTTYTQTWTIAPKSTNQIISSGSNTFCIGDSVILSTTQSSVYQWSNGSTTQEIIVYESGEYSVISTDEEGCIIGSDTIKIAVNPLPQVSLNFEKDTICLSELPVNLSGGKPEGGIYTGENIVNGTLSSEMIIPGIQEITYTYTDENNCMASTQQALYIDICSSTDPTDYSNDIKIIPNPNSGKFSIIIENQWASNAVIQVFNHVGKLVFEKNTLSDEVDLLSHPAGTYFVKIKMDGKIVYKKVVVF